MTAVLLLMACGAITAQAQTELPDAGEVAGSTAALVGLVASGVLTVTNINYSPEGNAVAGCLGVAVGVATAMAGVWWISESEKTRGEAIGGIIVAAGSFSICSGARSVRQASKHQAQSRSVRVSPLITRDRTGATEAGVAVVVSF